MKHVTRFLSSLFIFLAIFPIFLKAESPLDQFALTQSDFITAKEAAQLIWDMTESEYSDLFAPISIDYSEWGLVVYVERKGLAAELASAYAQGFGPDYLPWVDYKANFLAAYNNLSNLLAQKGRSDLQFQIWLYNDDTRSGKRSPFIKYLTAATDGNSVAHDVMWRYDEPEQDVTELPDDIQPIHAFIKESLATIGFDYISLFYNEKSKLFIIEVAIKDVGANLYHAKQAGNDEDYPPWKELKEFLLEAYRTMLIHLAEIGRSDISIMFELVNDEVYISGYNDRVSFDPLFSITNVVIKDGVVLWDVME